jgi:hypothetical protein
VLEGTLDFRLGERELALHAGGSIDHAAVFRDHDPQLL